ncbi:MAG: histidinol dehydrogenase [Leptospirales bacterium]|nr:histidinol dehydrogenase [Leptospirales bacterium]
MQRSYAQDEEAFSVARTILARVEAEGTPAVIEYSQQFDKVRLSDVLVSPEEWKAADTVPAAVRNAFTQAYQNISAFHGLHLESLQNRKTSVAGTELGFKYLPVETAAMYVPGGKASYPSSVLMGLIPAVIAGVKNRLVVTPPDASGSVIPEILFCAKLAGATEIIKAGGVQGLAAAAFGNRAPGLTTKPAQVLVGPGNRYVTAAKAILASRGLLRIDMPAGPSEVLVIADHSARPDFVAADLLSQAEHGSDSAAVLCCLSEEFAKKVDLEIERGFAERPARREMKETSIREHSFALVFENIQEAVDFSNEYAPEHLEICTQNPAELAERITSAGSVFLGHYAPVALGDYFSGTNHILPTGQAAHAFSGLGVETFMKRITFQHPTKESLRQALEPIQIMSKVEGLEFEHGHSVEIRFKD